MSCVGLRETLISFLSISLLMSFKSSVCSSHTAVLFLKHAAPLLEKIKHNRTCCNLQQGEETTHNSTLLDSSKRMPQTITTCAGPLPGHGYKYFRTSHWSDLIVRDVSHLDAFYLLLLLRRRYLLKLHLSAMGISGKITPPIFQDVILYNLWMFKIPHTQKSLCLPHAGQL